MINLAKIYTKFKINIMWKKEAYSVKLFPFHVVIYSIIILILSIVYVYIFRSFISPPDYSIFDLHDFFGDLIRSLIIDGKYQGCYDEIMGIAIENRLCFQAPRMPLIPWFFYGAYQLLGDSPLAINFVKSVLVALLLGYSGCIVLRRATRKWVIMAILLIPFALPIFAINIVNVQVEEAYIFPLLSICITILIFIGRSVDSKHSVFDGVVFSISLVLLFYSKSSMQLVSLFLLIAFLVSSSNRTASWMATLICLPSIAAWPMYTWAKTGRVSFGTSLDGWHLHKGNNLGVIKHYPNKYLTLDPYDKDIDPGRPFTNEWEFSDYHMQEALVYMSENMLEWLQITASKVWVLLFSLEKIGGAQYGGLVATIELLGLSVFRAGFWLAIIIAGLTVVRRIRQTDRFSAIVFLGVAFLVSAPYIIGFAFTRHSSILIYPTFIYLAKVLIDFSNRHRRITESRTLRTDLF